MIKDALVTLASTNFEELINFYTQLLEKKPTTIIPNIYAEFQICGWRLGIFQPKQTHASEFASSSTSKISLCLEVSNLENAIAHLTTLGYPPPGEISLAAHGREIYAYDPDGNRLILHEAINSDRVMKQK
ncbi:glyoxalase/bleomycin resistance/dioxygenase family protein [Fortiea contorta]|uniref:glyoxalase/bleomycin resistance/dioxygenase family protein n=1 Tax=Fortiea contorta TaxID=1892405 RepID=UPI00037E2E03|nr:glyoxalase/bleomycin resistance/dioxygenase family protein [Fortiea contorta]